MYVVYKIRCNFIIIDVLIYKCLLEINNENKIPLGTYLNYIKT